MIKSMPTVDQHVSHGRNLILTGGLAILRYRLGLTRSAMAEMLHMSPITYNKCEDRDMAGRVWASTAERLGRFCWLAENHLERLHQEGIEVSQLSPLHVLATQYGLPQELILSWYRSGELPAVDLGVLGLWLHKEDEHLLLEAV